MFKNKRSRLTLVLGVFTLLSVCQMFSKPLPEVSRTAIDEMGIEYGIPRMNGFVFVDGRYIPPPYTVVRRGNAIFINRIQIEQPVPWSYFDPEAETAEGVEEPALAVNIDIAAPAVETPREDPVEESNEKPARVASIDDLFGESDQDEEKTSAQEVKPKTISSIDDLFGEEEEKKVPGTVAVKNSKVDTLDDLFGTDGKDSASARKTEERSVLNAPRIRSSEEKLTPAQLEERKDILKKRLNEQRAFYERAIAKGELFFFGTMHNKINGTYGSARVLFEVLPSALRYSRSPEELLRRLQAGDVYFVDISVCEALYRNKTTFPLLQQRLEKIKQDEAIKEASRKEY